MQLIHCRVYVVMCVFTYFIGSKQITVSASYDDVSHCSEYVYLGHLTKLGKENQIGEITRRIRLGWAAFGNLSYVLRNTEIPINLKKKVFNACILPVMAYGLETMAITSKKAGKLRVAQRTMERAILGISLRDRVRIEEIRRLTRGNDVMEHIAKAKWQWAGHVARGDEKKWTNKLMQWKPRTSRRSAGRPQKRWVDPIGSDRTVVAKKGPR